MSAKVDFVLVDHPTKNIRAFHDVIKVYNIDYIIRISNNLYDLVFDDTYVPFKPFIRTPKIKDLYFEDGDNPPEEIIKEFTSYIKKCLTEVNRPIIGIHCDSSLGRAPCLIALDMINTNMFSDRTDIIQYIRRHKKDCFNTKQIGWILTYKKKKSKKCNVM